MNEVHAVIELRITPQRDCGFGKIAERVAKFEQVDATKQTINKEFDITRLLLLGL